VSVFERYETRRPYNRSITPAVVGVAMEPIRFRCPACRKEVEGLRPEVAQPRADKGKDDPLQLIRATCPACARLVQLSRLKPR
jgi:endogenous inhibitor of DNA gyrase (YacG/DUF329 family)